MVALGLEDWLDERQKTERAEALLLLVSTELASNRSKIAEEIEYHREMVEPLADRVRVFREDGEFSLPDGWEGTRPIALASTAFQLAVSSNLLARLEPTTALEIASVYELIERSEIDRANLSLATLQTDFRDGDRYLRLLSYAVVQEVSRADTLSTRLASASDLLEREITKL